MYFKKCFKSLVETSVVWNTRSVAHSTVRVKRIVKTDGKLNSEQSILD